MILYCLNTLTNFIDKKRHVQVHKNAGLWWKMSSIIPSGVWPNVVHDTMSAIGIIFMNDINNRSDEDNR